MQQKYSNYYICMTIFDYLIYFLLALETNGSIPYIAPTLNPGVPPKSNTICSRVYSHKVYETVNKEEDQVAIENVTSSRVRVHVWVPRLPPAYIETYNSTYFANTFINVRFKFIGNTTAGKLTYHNAVN